MRVREILNRVPFKLLIPFLFLAFYVPILLYVVLSPLIYLYGLLLCSRVWIEWEEQGKDMLIVHTDDEHSAEWMSRIRSVVGDRAVLLNFNQRDQWDRWSLSAQLFEIFGPQTIPGHFRRFALPSVIFFRKLHRPVKFDFRERPKDHETRLENLRSEIAAT